MRAPPAWRFLAWQLPWCRSIGMLSGAALGSWTPVGIDAAWVEVLIRSELARREALEA